VSLATTLTCEETTVRRKRATARGTKRFVGIFQLAKA
jgi:hypothetical protein